MERPHAEAEQTPATTAHVIDVALEAFAVKGFADTKLESIARASGMTKRMIHYHFGDKRGLYAKVLSRAVELLRPTAAQLEISSPVPAEGVEHVVVALYDQLIEHPAACRLLVMENLFGWADLTEISALADQSNVILALDRLLMLGQDAGAFRPGISALDVYTIVASMCLFRFANRATYVNLYRTDITTQSNIDGMRRLVVDAVLSFLTSNMSSSGVSYLTVDTVRHATEQEPKTSDIYGDGDTYSDGGLYEGEEVFDGQPGLYSSNEAEVQGISDFSHPYATPSTKDSSLDGDSDTWKPNSSNRRGFTW